jgi:hypothetical protein
MKLEQSFWREVTSGILPDRVPVTALAQLLASQAVVTLQERTPSAKAKARTLERNIIMVEWMFSLCIKESRFGRR